VTANPVKGLYAVTPEVEDADELRDKVLAALRGGVRLVQYRDKRDDARRRERQASSLAAMCRQYDARLIVNDDPELAAMCGAAGVHLGADDAPVTPARRLLGPDAVIGVSCYSNLERARQAAAEGASYVAFGALFPSATKPGARPAPLSLLREAREAIDLPIVAIGGIDARNASRVIEAGADAVAVVSALFHQRDVESEARRLVAIISAALSRRNPAETVQ
jgi:thiamine-phosphate pyrophosphorylase